MTAWLPAVVEMRGEWDAYCDHIYELFEADIRSARFFGHRVTRRRTPEVNGKPDGFWHVATEHFDQNSDDRVPDLRRCERVCWIGPMIDAAGTDRVLCFKSPRQVRFGHNIVLALLDYSYIVILGERVNRAGERYFMLVTAFPPRRGRIAELKQTFAAEGPFEP